MSKLIINIGSMSSGGAERVVSILTRSFADYYKQVEIVLWHRLPLHYTLDDRVKIVFLPDMSGSESRIKNCRFFRLYIEQQKPDILLSFLTPFNMLAIVSLFGCMKPKTVVCERNDPHFIKGGRIMEYIRNFLYRFADGALVQTVYGWTCYPSYIRRKMKVIYNPVLMPQDLVGKALQTSKEKRFVSVGRLDVQKNQKMLIRAFAEFCKDHLDYRLEIYGEGPLRKELELLICTLGIQDKVMLPGNTKNVWQKLLTAKAFLLSSDAEGMSNALIEAMCLGLPVVSTKVSGSTDLIDNGENGLIIEVGDTMGMIRAMSELADNHEYGLNMARKAISLYDKLNVNEISGQWISYLQSFEK